MIGRLAGILLEKTPTRVLVDIGGVGYEASIPLSTFAALPDEGKSVALCVHTHVRAEALQLYGFATVREKAVFELLLHASRVGPKLAQTILSGVEAETLVTAIREGEVATLRAAPGVGAKMAERIVVELRDRVDELAGEVGARTTTVAPTPADGMRQQLLSALLNLQTPRAKAEKVADQVLESAEDDAPLEVLIRTALRSLAR